MAEENKKDFINDKLNDAKRLMEKTSFWKGFALILFAIIILTQIFEISITPKLSFLGNSTSNSLISNNKKSSTTNSQIAINSDALVQAVIPQDGVELPIKWKDLGKRMVEDGVIDEKKFRALFQGGLTNSDEQMLSGKANNSIVMTKENSRFVLDMLWAFGLANKNDILENGQMTDKKYGGDASKFASTGGWTLANGKGFDHYSKHQYVNLTSQQQALVEEVAKNIYRPCCGNSTAFPDCNHGMAMLGLLELMASNGATENQMYQVALKVNSLWFPQTYIDLATYFEEQGQSFDELDPKLLLSSKYSSARGYQTTRQQIKSIKQTQQSGGGCGA